MDFLFAGIIFILNSLSFTGSVSLEKHFVGSDTSLPLYSIEINYRLDTLKEKTAAADFITKYTEEERDIILAINRISSSVIKKGKVLVMPDTLTPQMLAYSPFPAALTGFDSIPKLILISRRIQAYAIYENGLNTRWGPVSSGKKSTPTPVGLFHTNFKAKVKISSENSDWIMPWYFNFYARRGVAMHQYFLPGYPASHACVRMQEKDAKWIFDWADQWKVSGKTGSVIKTGTPVIIFGDYKFNVTKPWLNLPNDNQSTNITTTELEEVLSYLPDIHTDVILRK
jgi:L,D-transpeptidase catalytic domain